jgi:hypothetical protein
MGRNPVPFDQSPAREIYDSYRLWALESEMYPNPHAFWQLMYGPPKKRVSDDFPDEDQPKFKAKAKFRLTWSGFNYHWMQLQIMGLIQIDRVTGAVKVKELTVVHREQRRSAAAHHTV